MNTGNRMKAWYRYCLDSKLIDTVILNDKDKAELRQTKDLPGYCESILCIIYYRSGRINETQSENSFSKEELLEIWERNKESVA